jgi:hypothetical protein
MEEGEWRKEGEEVGMVQHRRRSSRGGAPDPVTTSPSTLVRTAEQVDQRSVATVENSVVCG